MTAVAYVAALWVVIASAAVGLVLVWRALRPDGEPTRRLQARRIYREVRGDLLQ